jgi:hypothetical protein
MLPLRITADDAEPAVANANAVAIAIAIAIAILDALCPGIVN